MFFKRLLLLTLYLGSLSIFAGGFAVSVKYVSTTLRNEATQVDLVDRISIGTKEAAVIFEKSDSSFRNWKISGSGYDGSAKLFVSKERGVGWQVGCDGDSLKVIIARDYRNVSDPRIISITTNFISGLYILENFEPECNSYFKVYSLKNSWDADVEYVGKYALEIEASSPCGAGNWHNKIGKLKVPQKVLVISIFTAIMTQNVRHLLRDTVL